MDHEDQIIVVWLTRFDRLMNIVTLGLWGWAQGRRPVGYKTKVEVD